MLTESDIRELVHGGEGFNVDFKQSVPSKVRDIAEEVCSFANSAGGYVLMGVDNGNRIVHTNALGRTYRLRYSSNEKGYA